MSPQIFAPTPAWLQSASSLWPQTIQHPLEEPSWLPDLVSCSDWISIILNNWTRTMYFNYVFKFKKAGLQATQTGNFDSASHFTSQYFLVKYFSSVFSNSALTLLQMIWTAQLTWRPISWRTSGQTPHRGSSSSGTPSSVPEGRWNRWRPRRYLPLLLAAHSPHQDQLSIQRWWD